MHLSKHKRVEIRNLSSKNHERVQETLKYPKSVEEDLWVNWNKTYPELLCSSENIYQVQLILLEYSWHT